jgi:transcription antitermination factor NusG
MAYWCCAQLQATRERLALHCLSKVNGFETYSPRIRPARARRGDDTRALFPGYCFVLIVSQWWAARWSPGIVRLVMDGLQPARVPSHVLDEIRRREVRGVVELPKPPGLQRGDKVRIVRGALQGHLALYEGMRPHERVDVLLQLLGGACRVTLARSDVAALGSRVATVR